MTGVVTLGETMGLLSSVSPGPLEHAATMALGIGGSESNVAIGVARLGVRAVWCGRVGADAIGRRVIREIRAEGVEVHATIDEEAPTGLMLKERRTAGAQRVSYYRSGSAGSRLSPDDLDPRTIADAAVLHITGITPALSPGAASAVRYAISTAQANGVLVSVDLNHRSALWSAEAAGAFYREILPQCDIVFAGEDEAAIAVGAADDPAELAARIAAAGPAQAVIKRGQHGALALIEGVLHRQQAVPIDAVDTVGASDAFVAGYLAETARGLPAAERLRTAVTTGAFACLAAGDWEGLPRRAELGLLRAADPVSR